MKIPDDSLNESFASDIILEEDIRSLVKAVNSLSNGVMLSTNSSSNQALTFEIDVVDDGDQFYVVKKVSAKFICFILLKKK